MDAIRSGGGEHVNGTIVGRWFARLRPGFMARRLRCQDMVELVTAYLEGALNDDMRTRFEQHLLRCDGCAQYLEQLRASVHTVGTIRDVELDPVFRARLLEAFADTAGTW